MRYSNVDFNVVYVDPSASTSGDGTTPATALNALPSTISGFVDATCYIIRRTDESVACTLPTGTNSNISNVILMGMPMASDSMWELVPEEAKTAWGTDAAEYANIQSTSTSSSFQLPYIERFLLHRIYLFRDGINADNYILKFYNSSDCIGCFAFEHCKFGSRGIDLDKATYLAELTTSRCKSYVYIYYARMVSISDCTINHAVTGNTSNAHGIYVRWSDVMSVTDVRVFSAAWRDYGQYYALCLSEDDEKGVECNIVNLTQTIRRNGSATHVPLLLAVQGYISMNVRNIKVETGVALSSSVPTSYVIDYAMLLFGNVYEMDADGIEVDLQECWNCKAPVLNFSRCYSSTYVPGVSKGVKNISVALASEAGIGSPITYSYATTDSENYAAVVMTFSSSEGSLSAKVPCIDSLTVKCHRGKAFYGDNLRITDATFEGTVVLRKCAADINSINTWFPGKAILVSEATHARVRKITCNVDNPDYVYNEDPAVGSTFDSNGSVFVDESNTSLRPMACESSEADHIYQMVTCNNEGESGHFAARCANGICDTWSVHREGGGAAALKLSNNACSYAPTMVLGRRPFNGMQLLPTTTGRHLLRAHIAFKAYAKPEELYRHFFLSAQVGDKTFYSSLHGRWADDSSSVWVNDSDLTQLVLEMPLDIVEVSPVDVRVYFSWYGASGFVYLDPAIELVGA